VKDKAHALVTDAESEQDVNAAGRLFVVSSNGRIPLWKEAARQSRYVRLAGTGAGTFPFTHERFREGGGVVQHAHSQWFNVLSELGVVGLVLFAAAVVLFVAAMVGNPFARRRDSLQPLLVALQAGVVVFFVHMSWDWDWDMAAVGTAAFVFIAVVVSYRRTRDADERRAARAAARAAETASGPLATTDASPETASAARPDAEPAGREESRTAAGVRSRRRRRGWGLRVVASAALLLLAAVWLPPYLAGRAQDAAVAAAADGRIPAALTAARRAASLDPLAAGPLLTQAALLQQQGRIRAALMKLREAARLQPQDFEVWYALGKLQEGSLGQPAAARASFTRALALNPLDGASRFELERLSR
jgi:Flp pilus assembly protein TadD